MSHCICVFMNCVLTFLSPCLKVRVKESSLRRFLQHIVGHKNLDHTWEEKCINKISSSKLDPVWYESLTKEFNHPRLKWQGVLTLEWSPVETAKASTILMFSVNICLPIQYSSGCSMAYNTQNIPNWVQCFQICFSKHNPCFKWRHHYYPDA